MYIPSHTSLALMKGSSAPTVKPVTDTKKQLYPTFRIQLDSEPSLLCPLLSSFPPGRRDTKGTCLWRRRASPPAWRGQQQYRSTAASPWTNLMDAPREGASLSDPQRRQLTSSTALLKENINKSHHQPQQGGGGGQKRELDSETIPR